MFARLYPQSHIQYTASQFCICCLVSKTANQFITSFAKFHSSSVSNNLMRETVFEALFAVQFSKIFCKVLTFLPVFKPSFGSGSFNSVYPAVLPETPLNPCRHTAVPLLPDNLIKQWVPCCSASGITAANSACPPPAEAHGTTSNALCLSTKAAPLSAVETRDRNTPRIIY